MSILLMVIKVLTNKFKKKTLFAFQIYMIILFNFMIYFNRKFINHLNLYNIIKKIIQNFDDISEKAIKKQIN